MHWDASTLVRLAPWFVFATCRSWWTEICTGCWLSIFTSLYWQLTLNFYQSTSWQNFLPVCWIAVIFWLLNFTSCMYGFHHLCTFIRLYIDFQKSQGRRFFLPVNFLTKFPSRMLNCHYILTSKFHKLHVRVPSLTYIHTFIRRLSKITRQKIFFTSQLPDKISFPYAELPLYFDF
jgi:hypothetical protein